MIVLVLIVGFIGGFFAAALCFSAKEERMQYREAVKTWRRMDGM